MKTAALSPVLPLDTPTFYGTVERRSLLLSVAAAWQGTPFFANSEAPGPDGGVDCVHLLHGIHHACGAIDRIAIPAQSMDHGQHSDRSLLIEAFETWSGLRERFACIWRRTNEAGDDRLAAIAAALLPGDTLAFTAGRVPHHGGLVVARSEFVHALKPDGVHRMRIDAVVRGWRVLGQLAAVYRPIP